MSKPNINKLQEMEDVGGLIAALGDPDWNVNRALPQQSAQSN